MLRALRLWNIVYIHRNRNGHEQSRITKNKQLKKPNRQVTKKSTAVAAVIIYNSWLAQAVDRCLASSRLAHLCGYAWNLDHPRCQSPKPAITREILILPPPFSIRLPGALLAGPFPGGCAGRISHVPIISLAATGIQGGLPAIWQRSLRRRSLGFCRFLRSELPPLTQLRHGAAQGRNPGSVLRVQAAAVAAHLFHSLKVHKAQHGIHRTCKRIYLWHD